MRGQNSLSVAPALIPAKEVLKHYLDQLLCKVCSCNRKHYDDKHLWVGT
jgi:hypothetical protein